ncbi:MAG: RluA family pseudouridine synthase [Bdellovibrionales bacterium]|nr:RluA family pseudouridine synthase [Ramlibacter sp.]
MRQDLLDLPAKNGVGASCVALPPGEWPTLLDFLAQQFPAIARAEWQGRMLRGDVLDAQGAMLQPDTPYRPRARVYYYRDLPQEPRIPFDETVIFQDEYLVVADKPHFLPVTPGGRYLQETLLVRLKRRLGIEALAPVHRIDRETAGLVLLAVRPDTRDAYSALFRDRAVHKTYEAIAPWRADLAFPMVYRSRLVEGESFMTMREAPGQPNSETLIDVVERQGDMARYRLEPHTGRRHQLRVQMAALGLPIVHDQMYPQLQPEAAQGELADYSRPLKLLAMSLAFTDPVTKEARRFESALRLDFD